MYAASSANTPRWHVQGTRIMFWFLFSILAYLSINSNIVPGAKRCVSGQVCLFVWWNEGACAIVWDGKHIAQTPKKMRTITNFRAISKRLNRLEITQIISYNAVLLTPVFLRFKIFSKGLMNTFCHFESSQSVCAKGSWKNVNHNYLLWLWNWLSRLFCVCVCVCVVTMTSFIEYLFNNDSTYHPICLFDWPLHSR